MLCETCLEFRLTIGFYFAKSLPIFCYLIILHEFEMTEKSRNFRSSYYDKVGFRGVEEKKALEILINEKSIDKEKLSKFCLRYTLPSMYREYVWKMLLGVLPMYPQCHEKIMKIRTLHYDDLESSLKIMRKINENTPKSIVHVLMYLMTIETLEFNLEDQLSRSSSQSLVALALLFVKLSSSEVVSYFMFRNFVLHQKKMNWNFKILTDNLETNLMKEDEVLYEHLKLINAFEIIPFTTWFERCFAEILDPSSLARLCDKIIGGNCKILPFVGIALLMVRKRSLLAMENSDKIVELLEKNSEDTSDVIVNKALDMYYK